ncbi:hypothetical protein GJAV_G00078160 [Gymnothorax javanicus]|nr:hypothetical protein GJAV_G00078160 [Gymnothorax javanicus]
MAFTINFCWMLILSTCFVLMVGAECDKDCAFCSQQMQGRQAEINAIGNYSSVIHHSCYPWSSLLCSCSSPMNAPNSCAK